MTRVRSLTAACGLAAVLLTAISGCARPEPSPEPPVSTAEVTVEATSTPTDNASTTPEIPTAAEVEAQCAAYADRQRLTVIGLAEFDDPGIVAALEAADAVVLCAMEGRGAYGEYDGMPYQVLAFWQPEVGFPGEAAAAWLAQTLGVAGYVTHDPAADTYYTRVDGSGAVVFSADAVIAAIDDEAEWWRGESWVVNLVVGDHRR